MSNRKLLVNNERLDAIEAAKNNLMSQTIECLKDVDPLDEARLSLEKGSPAADVRKSLEQNIDERDIKLELLKVRANITRDQDKIDLVHKYRVLKKGSPLYGGEYQIKPKAFYSTSTSGANLAGTQNRAELMQAADEILYEEMGSTVLLEKESASKYIVANETSPFMVVDILEGSPLPTINDPEWVDFIEVTPYILQSTVDISRKALKSITEKAFAMFDKRIDHAFGSGISTRLFYGDTSLNQCPGLYYHADLQKITGASFNEEIAYNMIRKIGEDKAPKETRSFICNSKLEEKLKQRPYANNGGKRIIEKGLLCDVPLIVSEIIQDNHLWVGSWNTVLVVLFPREVLVDAYSSSAGSVLLKQWQPYFFAARNILWLCMSDDIT